MSKILAGVRKHSLYAQITFVNALLTYRVLQDSAPRYLGPLVAVADLPGRRALRSASTSRLVIPPIKLSTDSLTAYQA